MLVARGDKFMRDGANHTGSLGLLDRPIQYLSKRRLGIMAEQVEVAVNLTNQKVQFTGTARSNPPVTFDYHPPLGDGEGYTGLEMLLMSLAACSGTSIVALLRKMRKDVAAFKVAANGSRRETHPTSFDKIALEFALESSDATEEDLRKAIQLSEQSYCPVWAMLKNSAEIVSEYRITAP
jgi:putative redox protein